MNILFAITGISIGAIVVFLFSFDRKNIDFKKTLIINIYLSVDCVIYDEHNDWFNNLNCIRLIF